MSARISYVEIPAADIAAATAFYTGVFGWKIESSDLSETPYSMFDAGGLQGGLVSGREATDGGVLLYLSVDDIDATLSAIEGAGGQTVLDKFDIGGGYGFSATFRDPNGNLLGLVASR